MLERDEQVEGCFMAHGATAKMPLADLLETNIQPSVGTDAVDKVLHAIRNHFDMVDCRS